MIEIKKEQMNLIAALFTGIEDSMVKACLQGYMGNAYVENIDSPNAALIVSGEYSFFGGDPTTAQAEYLIKNLFQANQSESTVGIYSEDKPEWRKALLSVAQNNPVVVPRYGIAQKDYDFDHEVLDGFINAVAKEFTLTRFNEDIYQQAINEDWSKEFCETFPSAEDYLSGGFGYAVLDHGKMVSGASTMTVYDGGIEIQVATDSKYTRRGLALACAAALIKECTERGLRPCWDAANLSSLNMALKLGYEYKGEYTTIHMRKTLL